MGKLFSNPFRKKSSVVKLDEVSPSAPINRVAEEHRAIITDVLRALDLSPRYGTDDNMSLFLGLAEVFFPIDFIASRIANAHYEIKRTSDDSIVWCTGRSYKAQRLAKILTRPNCLQTWSQFVYMHFVNYYTTGNGFIRSAMSDAYNADTAKWQYCDNFWSIPTSLIQIIKRGNMPIFGVCDIDEVIAGYEISKNGRLIPTWQIWHDRDLPANLGTDDGQGLLMSPSRLDALHKTISTLKAVYDARNIIYTRCGALGILTNKAKDVTGHIAMTKEEKSDLQKQFQDTYGITEGRSPWLITDADLAYLRTGMSIAELQPFDETLYDAIEIAGQFGIPADLVPRKDNSTYDNKSSAEKGVYSGVIIPMAKRFCQEFTDFLGIEKDGFYIDVNFDDVECLQVGRKEAETVKTMVNSRCRQQFLDGLISYNDWRAQIHEAAMDGEVFSKTKFEMTDEELAFVSKVIGNNNNNSNPQQENGKDDEESAGADKSE